MLPSKLYHGTFERFLPSIMKEGLKPEKCGINYEFAVGHVYLTDSEDLALRWPDETENEELVKEKLVVLEIDVAQLDTDALDTDENVGEADLRDNDDEPVVSYQYPHVIPPSAIRHIRTVE